MEAKPGSEVRKRSILVTMTKNAGANLFRTGTGWLIVLFLPPLLVRVLDKPTYSVWLLLLQLAAYISVFDGGIQTAIARYVARAEETGDEGYLARFLSSAGLLIGLASLLTLLLTGFAAWQLHSIFTEIPGTLVPSARGSLLILGSSLAITLPFSVIAGFFLGLQKYEVPAFAGTAGRFSGALGTAWAAYHHQGLINMALWIALGNAMQCLMFVWFLRRREKRALLHHSFVEKGIMRDFLLFCSAMFVSQFSSILITGMDLPIVAAFDFRSAAFYGIAATLSNVLVVPHGAIVNTLIPVAAGFSANNDPERLGQVLAKTTRFATALLCLIVVPLLTLMPLFLRVWVGQDYAIHTLLLAQILILAQFIRLTMMPYATIGFAAGQQQRMLLSALAEGGVNLLCSLALVQLIGARGVAAGTLIGAVVGVALHFTVSLKKTDCVKLDRWLLLRQGILKPSAFAAPLVACALWVPSRFGPLLQVALATGMELLLFALTWRWLFDAPEREQLQGVMRHFTARFAGGRPNLYQP